MRHRSLRPIEFLNLRRDLRSLLQMMPQFILKLLDATFHGQLLKQKTTSPDPLVHPSFPQITDFSY
jgi:hypothetical protein